MRNTVIFIMLVFSGPAYSIRVTEDLYEGARHFVIKTRNATYWFDRQGGGISRMIDNEGNDWIAFRRDPWNKTPESAASSYRGIPNAVFQGDDGGCGHPGWDKCESTFEPPNVIRTVSKSRKWEWTWTFHNDFAEWKVLKTDSTRKYWFLYEGPAGGTFAPEISFWQNTGNWAVRHRDHPDHMAGQRSTGNWNRVLIGRDDRKNCLMISHLTPDDESDSYSYMGSSGGGLKSSDGMVVLGFGRTSDSKPLLSGIHKFKIEFLTQRKYKTTI